MPVLLEPDHQITTFDLHTGADEHLGDLPRPVGVERCFHLHRFEREQLLARRYLLANGNSYRDHRAGHRGRDVLGVAWLGLRARYPGASFVSAMTREGIPELRDAALARLAEESRPARRVTGGDREE